MLIYNTQGWIHISTGRPDRWFRWGLVEVGLTGLLFLLALPHGPVGIAVAWTLSYWILTLPAFSYAGASVGFSISPVLATVWRYVVACLLAGATTALITRNALSVATAVTFLQAATRVIIVSLVFFSLYLGAVIGLHQGTEPLQQVAKLFMEVVPEFSRYARRPAPASVEEEPVSAGR